MWCGIDNCDNCAHGECQLSEREAEVREEMERDNLPMTLENFRRVKYRIYQREYKRQRRATNPAFAEIQLEQVKKYQREHHDELAERRAQKKAGEYVPRRRGARGWKYSEEDKERIRMLRSQGWAWKAIAAELGGTISGVYCAVNLRQEA